MPRMFTKLLLIVLAAGAVASGLLVLRQRKVETIHEISRAYQRQRQAERTLWTLQAEIARRTRPEALREQLARRRGEWRPIPAIPSTLDAPLRPGGDGLEEPGG
jgi:hypothetical protein